MYKGEFMPHTSSMWLGGKKPGGELDTFRGAAFVGVLVLLAFNANLFS